MEISIKGNSEDVEYKKLVYLLKRFNEEKKIDVNFNGIKYKGRIETIEYVTQNNLTSRVINIKVITDGNY
jgi:hypothetical protein